jgi:hypothetical protein
VEWRYGEEEREVVERWLSQQQQRRLLFAATKDDDGDEYCRLNLQYTLEMMASLFHATDHSGQAYSSVWVF